MDYHEFLRRKVCVAPTLGFEIHPSHVNPRLKPHCQAIVPWLLAGGRRALFASFGLHKTVIQLETVRLAAEHHNSRGLIVIPLGSARNSAGMPSSAWAGTNRRDSSAASRKLVRPVST